MPTQIANRQASDLGPHCLPWQQQPWLGSAGFRADSAQAILPGNL